MLLIGESKLDLILGRRVVRVLSICPKRSEKVFPPLSYFMKTLACNAAILERVPCPAVKLIDFVLQLVYCVGPTASVGPTYTCWSAHWKGKSPTM